MTLDNVNPRLMGCKGFYFYGGYKGMPREQVQLQLLQSGIGTDKSMVVLVQATNFRFSATYTTP